MVRIAVTGGIACGKSVVASFLAQEGIAVCEADDLAHELMMPGTSVYDDVVSVFGKEIVQDKGTIDRTTLGARVFADPTARRTLNALVHPAVCDAWNRWLAEQQSVAAAVVVPLLYEEHYDDGWDYVLCVAAAPAVQAARLAARGLSATEIDQRLNAQMPTVDKMRRADFVIVNNSTKELLKLQTKRVLNRILET